MAEDRSDDHGDLLIPIQVAGYGRVGSTALMALLGTDERVAFDRRYPFENRYLTYVAKLSLLAAGPGGSPHLDAVQLHDFTDDHFGAMPWSTGPAKDGMPVVRPSTGEWLSGLWRTFSASVRRSRPHATHYAEKVPFWLAAIVREVMPCRVIHLVRDPRDVFLSARAFARVGPALGFGMEAGTSEMDQARHTAHGLLTFAENEAADRERGDRCLVRYEDWAEHPDAVVRQLNRFVALDLSAGDAVDRIFDSHATSADLGASVGRWRHEPFSREPRMLIERHLARQLVDYGYEIAPDVRPAEAIVPGPEMRCSSDGSVTSTVTGALVQVWGEDFWVELPLEPTPADAIAELWICLRGTTGDHCSVYWPRADGAYDQTHSIHVPFRPGWHWQIARFRLDRHPLWQGMLSHLRLDLFNGTTTPGTGEVRWVNDGQWQQKPLDLAR